jgi:tripartite-type tricarboxylate transporter receptor subunit TctC
VPVRNVKEMVALARARPGQLSYASSGNFLYLTGALFTSMAKVEMLHVPFKGGAQAMPAVMSGEVASSFATIVSSLPLVGSGKLRGLAVRERSVSRPRSSFRPSPSPACRATRQSPGTACLRPPARRRTSSRGSTPTS